MKSALIAGLALIGAFIWIFFFTPTEATQGLVQKIFYIHVAAAITMYVGFFGGFLCSLLYLLDRKLQWDEISVSAVEVGFFFASYVLISGPIWAKPIWGAWWDWDPRLTMTLLLWLLYAAYLVLRGYFGSSPRGRTISAIVAIIAFLDVPLIHYSVRIWRGIHPSVVANKEGLPASMQTTLVFTLIALLIFFSVLFIARLRLEKSRNLLSEARLNQSEG